MKPRRRKASAAWAMSFGLLGSSVALAAPMAMAGTEAPPVSDGTVIISNVSELLYVDRNQTAYVTGTTGATYLEANLELQPDTAFDLSGQAWVPLGSVSQPFTGTFDGSGDTVSGLSITVSIPSGSDGTAGMFGAVSGATLENVGLAQESVAVTVTGRGVGTLFGVGGLVGAAISHTEFGASSGKVTLTDVTGSDIGVRLTADGTPEGVLGGILGGAGDGSVVDGVTVAGVTVSEAESVPSSMPAADIGGIAGALRGATASLDQASAVDVAGVSGFVGGLFGYDSGSLSGGTATGSVVGHGLDGGLVGYGDALTLTDSTADVAVTSGYFAGGLVGLLQEAVVSGSIAEGAVAAAGSGAEFHHDAAGGLVGASADSAVRGSIAVGAVTDRGAPAVTVMNGGLLGIESGGTVGDSYALGQVSGGATSDAALEVNGGLVGGVRGPAQVSSAFAMGDVASRPGVDAADGGLLGLVTGGVVTVDDAYVGGTLSGDGAVLGGILGLVEAPALDLKGEVAFRSGSDLSAVGNLAAPTGITSGSMAELAGVDGSLHDLAMSSGWTELGGINDDLPILDADLVPALTPATATVAPLATDPVTVGLDYLAGMTANGPSTEAVNVGTVDLPAISHGFAAATVLTGSTAVVNWQAPAADGTSTLMGAHFLSPVAITVSGSGTGTGTGNGRGAAPNTPPAITTTPVHVAGTSGSVISSLGYNVAAAIGSGTFGGYVTERTALQDGLTTTGEGGASSYVVDILSGSGLAASEVSATEQGQFAALYQKLGIIPDTAQKVSAGAAVTALVKAKASPLAIENYLVQLEGFTWVVAAAEAAAGFPIKNT